MRSVSKRFWKQPPLRTTFSCPIFRATATIISAEHIVKLCRNHSARLARAQIVDDFQNCWLPIDHKGGFLLEGKGIFIVDSLMGGKLQLHRSLAFEAGA